MNFFTRELRVAGKAGIRLRPCDMTDEEIQRIRRLAGKVNPDIMASWAKFLNPDALKQNLIIGGLYLAAFELLKQSLIGRPRDFFWNGIRDGEDYISPEYETKVLALHKHRYTASALWWQTMGAIDAADLDKLREVREHRDEIAHDMPKMLGTIEHCIRVDLLCACHDLLFKMDNWWIRNIEIDTDPDLEGQAFTPDELDRATSSSALFLSLMLPIAAGDDSQLRSLYEMWTEAMTKAEAQPE